MAVFFAGCLGLCLSFSAAGAGEGNSDLLFQSANTRFAFKLFDELSRQNPAQNLLISPLGIESSLALALNGAAGDTRKAMIQALELKDLPLPDIDKAHDRLRTALDHPDLKVELTIADSIWAKKGTIFKPSFSQHGLEFFRSEIAGVDFSAPSAVQVLNGWVKRKTKVRISRIVDKVDPQTALLLLNAVYFKGKWTIPFDRNLTREGDFTPANGVSKKIFLMSQSGRYPHFQENGFQAVSLPYGKGRIRMDIFLPDKESSLERFLKNLTAENWGKWMPLFKEAQGEIVLPRFKLECETDLKDALKTLGMEAAFDPERANFENLAANGKLFISEVRHKACAETSEEGTGAAAAAAEKDGGFRMEIDRPFFLVIRDSQTGILFLMGSVADLN